MNLSAADSPLSARKIVYPDLRGRDEPYGKPGRRPELIEISQGPIDPVPGCVEFGSCVTSPTQDEGRVLVKSHDGSEDMLFLLRDGRAGRRDKPQAVVCRGGCGLDSSLCHKGGSSRAGVLHGRGETSE